MQDSGLYNELDEKHMVRYSDIVKGSITKYEGLKDETEKILTLPSNRQAVRTRTLKIINMNAWKANPKRTFTEAF